MDTNNNFNKLEQPIANTLLINKEKYLYFGGTAYLGIPQNQEIRKRYMEGIQKYGLNNGTSRGNNVQLGIYDETEEYMANNFGSEAALITSSGYIAASLSVRAFQNKGQVRYAPNTHPALWVDGVPIVKAKSFSQWADDMVMEINQSKAREWVLISNSMNNLFPEIYDFSFLKNIRKDKSVIMVIDDSHGIGILNGGDSVLSGIPKYKNIEIVVAASMAKALGTDAGVVLGSKKIIQSLKLTNEFYGGSPPSAAGLYAFIKSKTVYEEAFKKLQENINYFANGLKHKNLWSYVESFPVFLCRKEGIEQHLLQEKILISSFPYPDRNGKPLNRIVLSSWHKKAELQTLLKILNTSG